MKKLLFAACLLLASCSFFIPNVHAEEYSPHWLERVEPETVGMDSAVLRDIDAVVGQAIEGELTPGAVVAIGRGNKLCYLKGYGYRQFYPEKEKITLDTLFDLASVTKVACTATALAVVIDQGKIAQEDLVIKYFPEFGVNGKEHISLWNCMTHTSGIKDYYNQTKGTQEELWNLLCGLELQYPVNERFDYKDNNTLMLGHIVEKVSEQDLRTFTIENIYHPLGMFDTMHNPDAQRRKRAAATETRNDIWFKGVVNDYRSYNLGGVSGHCGLFSTAPDLAILSALWLGKGTLIKKDGTKTTLFGEATFEKMIAPQKVSAGIRGLNWDKRSGSKNRPWNMTPRAIGHGGWTGTSIWIDPNLDLFVVVLGNRRHPFGKSPGIYPTAARVGVIAVNAIRRETPELPKLLTQSVAALKGTKIALVVDEAEVGRPNGLPSRLKKDGVEIVALFYPSGSSHESSGMTYQVVPKPDKIDVQSGAPVYRLTRDCPRVLPPSVHGAAAILFAPTIFADSSEESFSFMTTLLGGTLQSASDNGLRYYIVDSPNPLAKKRIEPTGIIDKFRPFGSYSRLAREQGLSFGEIARRINIDQMLDVEISLCSGTVAPVPLPAYSWNRPAKKP